MKFSTLPLAVTTVRRSMLVSALFVLVALNAGCESLSYYTQSVSGHLGIMAARTDISSLIADAETSSKLRSQLQTVLEIRDFASAQLALPDNQSYRSYVDVGSPYVVWNVVAAPEFSLQPKTWCFLVVGCLAYRGYYHRHRAVEFAQQQRELGLDVALGGSRAYSTLGWFNDPLLNTMLDQSEAELAAVIFHELAHQVIYIDDDTAFNEAFAVAVEREGVARWMAHTGDADALAEYAAVAQRNEQFIDLLLRARGELSALYALPIPPAQMRQRKEALFARVRERYQASGLGDDYAGWFGSDLNNAKLALVATYWEWVPAFQKILARNGRDMPAFYQAVGVLGRTPTLARHAELNALLD